MVYESWIQCFVPIQFGVLSVIFYQTSFIDLATVRDVHPAPEDFQDKTGSTFYIISEGRTYEILAMNPNQMNEYGNHMIHAQFYLYSETLLKQDSHNVIILIEHSS